jgi:hypothetical protein
MEQEKIISSNTVLPAVFRYVWLNLNNGKFSNSWDENQQKYIDAEMIEKARKDNWKLIKYECLSDQEFEFYNLMKIVTAEKNGR